MKNFSSSVATAICSISISILLTFMLFDSFSLAQIEPHEKVMIGDANLNATIPPINQKEIEDSAKVKDVVMAADSAMCKNDIAKTDSVIQPKCKLIEEPTIPTNISNYPITHKGHTLSFNLTTHCPNWVAWKLTKEMTNGRWARSNDYRSDRLVPFDHRVDEKAFSGSGYDRGHMCPAGDMSWDSEAMSATFLMSNMCPQAPTLNQRWWEHLESACRRWANQEGEIYICCGPIYKGNEESIGSYPPVTIPSAFFKVILSLRTGKEKAIGFYYLNNDSRQPMGDAEKSIDEIEELTGFDFFPMLNDDLEERLESSSNLKIWN